MQSSFRASSNQWMARKHGDGFVDQVERFKLRVGAASRKKLADAF